MRAFVLVCLASVAVARPQDFGYSQGYNQGYDQGYQAPTLVSERTYTIRPDLSAPAAPGGYGGGYSEGYSGGYSSGYTGGFDAGAYGQLSSGGFASAYSNPLQQQQPLVGETKIFKHIYAFAAPEEPQTRARVVLRAPVNTRKHYKLIFIKAPSSNTVVDSDITLPAQEEEKTQIYVLSKQQNQQPVIRVHTQQAAKHNKPEVVFVKYRNEAEAQAIANGAISGQNSGLPAGGELVTDGSVRVAGAAGFGSQRF